MHHSHRTWFPYILIGLSIALLLAVIAFNQNEQPSNIENMPVLEFYEYQEEVLGILDSYEQGSDAQIAYESLLKLRISEDEKQVHLDLVLMFGKLLNGELDSIDDHLIELDQTDSWLIE